MDDTTTYRVKDGQKKQDIYVSGHLNAPLKQVGTRKSNFK